MIFEIVQAQPSEFGVGYYSGRIWINGVGMNRKCFSDFASDNLLSDTDNLELMLCSRTDDGSTLRFSGDYDVMNFKWFKGSESLFVSTDGKLCLCCHLILIYLP